MLIRSLHILLRSRGISVLSISLGGFQIAARGLWSTHQCTCEATIPLILLACVLASLLSSLHHCVELVLVLVLLPVSSLPYG